MQAINDSSQTLFDFDNSYNKKIIGTDEAGRGPGAGGVFAAAVYFDNITDGLIKDLSILNDSKKLSAKKREAIFDTIKNNTINEIVCIEVEEIETVGKPFDPEFHEAVSRVQDPTKEDQIVVEEFRKGYKIGNKVVRHSMVIVAN